MGCVTAAMISPVDRQSSGLETFRSLLNHSTVRFLRDTGCRSSHFDQMAKESQACTETVGGKHEADKVPKGKRTNWQTKEWITLIPTDMRFGLVRGLRRREIGGRCASG